MAHSIHADPAASQAALDELIARFRPVAVVLFGSRARGMAGPNSDTDLLVVLPDGAGSSVTPDVIQALGQRHGQTWDIALATPEVIRRRGHVAGSVLRAALEEGRVLYHRDGSVAGTRAATCFPPERGWEVYDMRDPETAAAVDRWLAFARRDLQSAAVLLREAVTAPAACYHAQQAAEKALKAALVAAGVAPPRTHSIQALRDRLPAGWSLPAAPVDLQRLSRLASAGRYPDTLADPDPDECAWATDQARRLVDAVAAEIAARRSSPEA